MESSRTTQTALVLAGRLFSEMICMHVHVLDIVAVAAIYMRAAFISLRAPDCAATV